MEQNYIIFNCKILKGIFKILTIFHRAGTMWCDGNICEIVVTSDVKISCVIPFKETNIIEPTAYNIDYDIYNTTIDNSIADVIKFIFNEDKLLLEEQVISNKINFYDKNTIHTRESISKLHKYNISSKFVPVIVCEDMDFTEDDSKMKAIKQTDQGDYSIKYNSKDYYKYRTDMNYNFRINLEEYNDVAYIFRCEFQIISNIIKKLIISKADNIILEFLQNSVSFTALRNDTMDTTIFKCSLLENNFKCCKKYILELKHFSLLKKLSISITDFEPIKDKKIFKIMQFHIIKKNDNIIGTCIYPGGFDKNLSEHASNYFIFIPLREL